MGSRDKSIREFQQRLGHKFKNRGLLDAALTHPSYRFENADAVRDNQRMEFLGDAVLDLVLADFLFRRFTDSSEGALTAARSRLASGKALAEYARALGIGEFLRMGKGEEASGGRRRASNLADAFEALIGAAFLDRGIKAARAIFERVILPHCGDVADDHLADNPKGRLQEYAQRFWKQGPHYWVIREEGPAHARIFTVGVRLPDGEHSEGSAGSKQEAESIAADHLLDRIAPSRKS